MSSITFTPCTDKYFRFTMEGRVEDLDEGEIPECTIDDISEKIETQVYYPPELSRCTFFTSCSNRNLFLHRITS